MVILVFAFGTGCRLLIIGVLQAVSYAGLGELSRDFFSNRPYIKAQQALGSAP